MAIAQVPGKQPEKKAGAGNGGGALEVMRSPLGRFVIPTAVVAMVDRQRHPIIWTVFGAIPLGFATVNLIQKRRTA